MAIVKILATHLLKSSEKIFEIIGTMMAIIRNNQKSLTSPKEKRNTMHNELVSVAAKWLKSARGCNAVIAELVAKTTTGEIPDVIGWKSGISILIEVKTSRSDFLRDKHKPCRRNALQGVGHQRYFLCPHGIIQANELPEGWGLIYVKNEKARCVQKSGTHEYSQHNELILLASALSRYQG